MSKDRFFIERRPQGDYAVRKPNSERASDVLPTQSKAIERAQELNPNAAVLVERVRHTDVNGPDKWEETMSKVTVHRFKLYDIKTDSFCTSRRWATKEAVDSIRGEITEGTATEVDASFVGGEILGMTEREYRPNARTGFQRLVTR